MKSSTSISIEDDLLELVHKEADLDNRTFSNLVEVILREWIENKKSKSKRATK